MNSCNKNAHNKESIIKDLKLRTKNYNKELEDFLNLFNLDNNKKNEFKKRVKNKSLYIYSNILKFINKKNIEDKNCNKYDLVHSIFIYDKRIRKILYEFIAFIEEKLRSNLLNNYDLMEEEIDLIFRSQFSEIVNKNIEEKLCDEKYKEIVKLRNDVFHSKMILINIKKLKINNENIKKIIILYDILNDDVREDFLKKIEKIESKKINYKYKDNIKFTIPDKLKLSSILKQNIKSK